MTNWLRRVHKDLTTPTVTLDREYGTRTHPVRTLVIQAVIADTISGSGTTLFNKALFIAHPFITSAAARMGAQVGSSQSPQRQSRN